MKIVPGCIRAKKASSAMARVVGRSGTCRVTMRDCSRSSSREQNSSGPSASILGGSFCKTLKPKYFAIRETRDPTFPTPMTPIV